MTEIQAIAERKKFADRRGCTARQSGLLKTFWELLPSAEALAPEVWNARHRLLIGLTWIHALLIAILGLVFSPNGSMSHAISAAGVVGLCAVVAAVINSRALGAAAVSIGLLTASSMLVHFSGGAIELHVHAFVIVAFLALYQDRIPYILCLAYAAIYYGVIGTIWPDQLYGRTVALNAPWIWAAVQIVLLVSAAAASLMGWSSNRKTSTRSQLVVNSVAEALVALDLEGKITLMNPAAAALLRCDAQAVLGKPLREIMRHTRFDGTELSKPASFLASSAGDGPQYQSAYELFWRSDGTSFPVDYKCAPIFEDRTVTGLVVAFADITSRKQRETRVRESEERFRAITENIDELVWITDPADDKKLYVSPAYRKIWDRDPAKTISLSESWLGSIHPDDLGRVLTAVKSKQLLGQYDEEYRILRADGSVRWIRDRAFPVRNEAGEVYRIIGLAQDITERKRAEADLLSRHQAATTLHELSQLILSATDLEPVLEKILARTLTTLSIDLGNIRLFESVGRMRVAIYQGYSNPETIRLNASRTNPRSEALVMRIIDSGKSLVLDNVAAGDGLQAFEQEQLRSALVVPIIMDRETLGVIEVGSRNPHTFRPSDIQLLEAIGNQVGLAVQKARLMYQAEQRAHEQGALNIIAKALGQSLHTDELLKIALQKIFEVTGRERLSVKLKDADSGRLRLAAQHGFGTDELKQLTESHSDSATEEVFASGQPLVLNNTPREHSDATLPEKNPASIIPLKAGTHIVGVLRASAVQPIRFELHELELLEAIGNMIGVALENARLFGETETRYRELKILQAISDTILESLDLAITMERILDKAFEIGRFDFGVVRLFDRDHKKLKLVASRGERDPAGIRIHYQANEENLRSGILAEVIASKQTRVKDLSRSEGMRSFRREGVSTVVVIPLHTQQHVLGVIQLGSRTAREFPDTELRIFDAIGDQAGIAVQKARLYEDSQQAQAALRQKAAELASSNDDLQRSAEEVKRAKEKLERVNSVLTVQAAELARSNTELEQFAYVASHDLQEPLRMVASYVQLLARRYKGKLDSDAEEFISFAVDGSKRMQDLIQALLAYSRIGTKARQFATTDCQGVLQIALKNLQIAIEESHATVTCEPLPTIMGDATQLAQLFQNLIANAIKFRGDKLPAVHVRAERQGNDWLFSFSDNGIGIDPQYAERIFIIFQRLHTKEEYPGTGIGLALCKKIVERHNGRIWVESQPQSGSTFLFTLPAQDFTQGEGDKRS